MVVKVLQGANDMSQSSPQDRDDEKRATSAAAAVGVDKTAAKSADSSADKGSEKDSEKNLAVNVGKNVGKNAGKAGDKNKPGERKTPPAPDLSDYLDYRQYLNDFYDYKRNVTASDIRPFNYQMFSAAANIKSPNYLKMIIEGQRNLSEDMVQKFSKALSLNKDSAEELRLLVLYNQTADPADRNVHLKRLSEHRVRIKLKHGEIDKKTWEKVPNWIAWVIYAMIDMEGIEFDVSTLKALFRNKATEDEIESALNGLLGSGELIRDLTTGKIRRASSLIEQAEDVPVALVRKLQAQLMYLGLESLYQDAPTEREFGTLTMALTKAEFDDLKFKLRQLRKSIHKDNSISRTQNKGERIYQLNLQLYPITGDVSSLPKAPAAAVKPESPKESAKALVNSLAQEAAKSAASIFQDADATPL